MVAWTLKISRFASNLFAFMTFTTPAPILRLDLPSVGPFCPNDRFLFFFPRHSAHLTRTRGVRSFLGSDPPRYTKVQRRSGIHGRPRRESGGHQPAARNDYF